MIICVCAGTSSHDIDELSLMRGRLSFKMVKKESTCPYCGLVGKGGNMKRYHFENCRNKKEL